MEYTRTNYYATITGSDASVTHYKYYFRMLFGFRIFFFFYIRLEEFYQLLRCGDTARTKKIMFAVSSTRTRNMFEYKSLRIGSLIVTDFASFAQREKQTRQLLWDIMSPYLSNSQRVSYNIIIRPSRYTPSVLGKITDTFIQTKKKNHLFDKDKK